MVRIRELVKNLSENSAALKLLKNDPAKFAEENGLNKKDTASLLKGDLLIVKHTRIKRGGNISSTLTFTTGTTITAGRAPTRKQRINPSPMKARRRK